MVLVAATAASCSASPDTGWIDDAVREAPTEAQLRIEGLDEGKELVGVQACGELGDEEDAQPGSSAEEPATDTDTGTAAPSVERGVGNDPYTATGAREVPGPDMTAAPLPDEPTASVVARPVDPDEHVAARNPDRQATGPVPSPKVIGREVPTSADDGAGDEAPITPEDLAAARCAQVPGL